jgi:hypothetical protein
LRRDSNDGAFVVYQNGIADSNKTAEINADGSATFNGKVTAGASHTGGEIFALGKSSGTSYMAFHNGGANMGFIGYADQLISGGASNELGIRSQDDILFSAGGNTERVRVTSNGLTFNGDTAAANALDDYEEGDWTPTVQVEGQNNATTDKQNGRYVKIGSKVTVWAYVQLNGTPSGRGVNNAWIHGGLPFPKRNDEGGFDIGGPIMYWSIDSTSALNGTAPYMLVARLFNNSSGGRIRGHDSSNNQSGQNLSLLLKDNTEYAYSFTYETTA